MWFELSTNGTEWEKPQLQGKNDAGVIDYLFTQPTRHLLVHPRASGARGGEEVRFPGKRELEERTC